MGNKNSSSNWDVGAIMCFSPEFVFFPPESMKLSASIPSGTLVLLIASALASPLSAQAPVHIWGSDDWGVLSSASTETGLTGLAAGSHHALALRSNGSVVAWGLDNDELGNFGGQVSNAPTATGFTALSGGTYHSLALRSDGSIMSWGSNLGGQVSGTPAGAGFTQIDAGSRNSVALRADGSIAAWGADGHGNAFPSPAGSGYTHVAAGVNHGVALRADGSLFSWGMDTENVVTNTPSGTGFVQVSAGNNYSLALRANGSLTAWGTSNWGIQSDLPAGTGFAKIMSSGTGSMAVRANGSFVVWASVYPDVLSNAPTTGTFTEPAMGSSFAMAIGNTNAGNSFCYGDGSAGPCPCLGAGPAGEGCPSSWSAPGAKLKSIGHAFIAADSIQFNVSGVPGSKPGLILQGTQSTAGGQGMPLGAGLLCVTGTTARSQVQITSAAGTTSFTNFQGQSFGAASAGAGSSTYYQFWYRTPHNYCTTTTFNFSNAWELPWLP